MKGKDSTAQRATDSGSLDSESALARELAATFDIPLGMALQVASGQLPLEEAQQRATSQAKETGGGPRSPGQDPASTREEIRRVLAGDPPRGVAPPVEPARTPESRSRARELAELSATHGLPKHLAEMVLDGRLTARAAVAQKEAVERTIDEVVDMPSPAPARSAGSDVRIETAGSLRGPNYDPGFRAAIAEGHLTVQQAVQRGNRAALARRLQQRHGLSERLAFRVADNRTSIREIRQQRASRPAPVPRTGRARTPAVSKRKKKRSTGRMLVYLLLILSATAAAGLVGWNRWQLQVARTRAEARPAPIAAAPPVADVGEEAAGGEESAPDPARPTGRPGTEVLTDEDGRVIRVTAPDPATVLETFCASVAGLDPIGLEQVQGTSGMRIGLLRDYSQPGQPFSIRIRRDNRSGRWAVGDGTAPVAPVPAS